MHVKRAALVVGLGAVLAVLPHLAGIASQPRSHPAWMADRPLPNPRVFAEGTISTADDEMDACFTPDGKTMYFTRNHMGQRLGVILEVHFDNGAWSAPEVASFSGRFTDYDPFIAPDGSKLFFASNRPTQGSVKKDFDIWVVDRTPSGWGWHDVGVERVGQHLSDRHGGVTMRRAPR